MSIKEEYDCIYARRKISSTSRKTVTSVNTSTRTIPPFTGCRVCVSVKYDNMKNVDVKSKKILVQGHSNVSNITVF